MLHFLIALLLIGVTQVNLPWLALSYISIMKIKFAASPSLCIPFSVSPALILHCFLIVLWHKTAGGNHFNVLRIDKYLRILGPKRHYQSCATWCYLWPIVTIQKDHSYEKQTFLYGVCIVSLVLMWVPSRCSFFLPQSKDMKVRWIERSLSPRCNVNFLSCVQPASHPLCAEIRSTPHNPDMSVRKWMDITLNLNMNY